MNSKLMRGLMSSLTLSIAGSIVAVAAHAAAADCAAPKGIAEQRACEAASQGPESLRRFSERTRNIYHIYVQDYDKAVAPRAAARAEEPTTLAATK